jgi:hypothetical protein
MLKRLKLFLGRCPNCTAKLDDSVHGFEKKYLHCHKCQFCTYEDDFRRKLADEYYEPEIGIWINCKNNTDYHTCIWHLDNNTKWDGRRFYNEVREYIDTSSEELKEGR